MTWAPIGQKWLAKHPSRVEPIEAGLEVCGFELERPLSRHHLGERWLARASDGTARLVYRVDLAAGSRTSRAFRMAAEMLLPLRHPHLLPILRMDCEHAGGRWLVSPYPGSVFGVVTLADVLRQRESGRLKRMEVVWAMEQLLGAVASAHRSGHCHGAYRLEEVAVDRRGRVVVELYGLGRRLRDLPAANPDARAEETRSVLELGYRLATGREWVDGDDGRAGVRSIGGGIGRWLECGLVARELETAEDARGAIRRLIDSGGQPVRRRA